MATSTDNHRRNIVSKPSKWFASKSLKLSFPRRRSSSKSTLTSSSSPSSSSSTSPTSPSPRNMVTHNREDELRQVFRYFDGDGDGKISASELRAYFGSMGEYMSYEEAEAVINELDTNGDSLLDFEDFLQLMKRDQGSGADQNDDDLKKAFEMFQLEKGGFITPRSLQWMLHRLGDDKSYDECVTMIQVYDTDGNGVLDFNEFHRMMA